MTRRRLRAPCSEPGCPTLTTDTHCPAHRRRSGRSPGWRHLARVILAERVWCEQCGYPTRAVEVDHITPIADGGAELDPANCQALCKPCHTAKTRLEA